MAIATTAQSQGQLATDILAAPTRGLAGLRRVWSDLKLYFRTLEELRELSPRDLADLGLAHSDLRVIARESVWGK